MNWRYRLDRMPFGRKCWVRTISGIECEASRSKYSRKIWTRNGVDRIHCWRRDIKSTGDLWVIAWKPMPTRPPVADAVQGSPVFRVNDKT